MWYVEWTIILDGAPVGVAFYDGGLSAVYVKRALVRLGWAETIKVQCAADRYRTKGV